MEGETEDETEGNTEGEETTGEPHGQPNLIPMPYIIINGDNRSTEDILR
jgi:hypothetical protein